ncbi:LuxR C-terminal-related transcriptional regulator [Nocardia takedensis]|uniref:LuxR C-terminal-related transcriptional regulator n=1 Tax=Nocardia takedensis TaxID=259390 RepID=UPI0003148440|nr:LuxR C-terminal-related transcriptional regulator [Nocardia takedensis]
MAEIALDTMPYARDIFRELDSADPESAFALLIRGRSGTGKSTLLAAVRGRLRMREVPVWDKVGVAADLTAEGRAPALIIDNAHTLGDDDFESLCAEVEFGSRTMVIATQPRPHDERLRALADAVARRGRVLDLRPLGVSDITPFARELGMAVPRAVAQHIHQQTGGIRAGVVAALSAACSTRFEAGMRAVDEAVAQWARIQLDDMDPDLLEALAVATTGTGLDSSELTEVLGIDAGAARRLIDRARASALVTDADLLIAPAVPALRTVLGDRRFLAVQRRLLAARLDAGLLRDHTALAFAEAGVRDGRLAEFLCVAAAHAGREAVRFYAAATAAGADPGRIALRWAEAAARAGDGETALRLAEPVLARSDASAEELADAVRICAGVLARRGLIGRAAQLYAWLGAHRVRADWAVAAAVHCLAGDLRNAAELSATAAHWPPMEADAQARLVATALTDTMSRRGDAGAAVSALVQAAHLDADTDRLPPVSAVSIATLLCLSTGEPRRAGEVLLRATDAGQRGHQLRVLGAWVAMLAGDEQRAATTLAAVEHAHLDPRDRLLAHGVAVGLARRGGDPAALSAAWEAAHPLFDDIDADLLTMLPVGELWLAGIRVGQERRVTPLVESCAALLRGLEQPPVWANAFHWYGVQAAIAHESPDDLLPHARSLKEAAQAGDRHAAVLADAGRTWVFVLRGEVSATHVASAVSGLRGIGLTWDAARLASEAALAADDSATATTLLKLARTVRAESRPNEPRIAQAAAPQATRGRAAAVVEPAAVGAMLSEREREVAELVLLGLTYREIGARLYISAKTVEHHVARIRRRIGAGSRSELLSMLRAMGHGSLLV